MKGALSVNTDSFKSFLADRGLIPVGDCTIADRLTAVKPINTASESDVTFCRFEGEVGRSYLNKTKAGMVFIPQSMKGSCERLGRVEIPCKFPRLEMLHFLSRFYSEPKDVQVGTGNPIVHRSANVASDVDIGLFSVIGADVVIGSGTSIGANCHIQNAVIGANTKIASGVVIGGSGFGFEQDPLTGETLEFPHIGGVWIGDGVSVGANTCIDRGSIGDTVINDQVKIDNLVHIAHNVNVGTGTKIIALSMIGGSVQIGENSWISPSVAIRDWRKIGKEALVGLGAVVTKDIEAGDVVVGNPAKSISSSRDRYK